MTSAYRILITGGAGSLGTNLVEHLLPRGHQILVLDNFATGKRGVLPDLEGLTSVEGSVTDESLLETLLTEFSPEIVIHSAASYKDPTDWLTDIDTNVRGSAVVSRAAERHSVKRLINFQTALCYGIPEIIPIPIDHACRPFTSYGISKTAGEQFILRSNVPSVSIRLANVTAPRLAIGPIPTFYQRLSTGKSCFCSDTVRDFLDIDDFLDFIDLALDPTGPSGVFNLSTGIGHSIKEIFEGALKHLGLPPTTEVPIVPAQPDDVPCVILDPSETTKAFGWTARVSFDIMLSKMFTWYDEHGVTDLYSHLSSPSTSQ